MKRVIHLSVLGLIVTMLLAYTPFQTRAACPSVTPTSNQVLNTYTWYADEYFTVYTGYTSTINTELYRLRSTYPSNIFSDAPDIGLSQFEFGYHVVDVPAVIYSDR